MPGSVKCPQESRRIQRWPSRGAPTCFEVPGASFVAGVPSGGARAVVTVSVLVSVTCGTGAGTVSLLEGRHLALLK